MLESLALPKTSSISNKLLQVQPEMIVKLPFKNLLLITLQRGIAYLCWMKKLNKIFNRIFRHSISLNKKTCRLQD